MKRQMNICIANSPINSDGYYSWQFDNETENGQDGYAGCFGVAIDKFQLC